MVKTKNGLLRIAFFLPSFPHICACTSLLPFPSSLHVPLMFVSIPLNVQSLQICDAKELSARIKYSKTVYFREICF